MKKEANFVSLVLSMRSNAGPLEFNALRGVHGPYFVFAIRRVRAKRWSMVSLSEHSLAFYMIEYHEERVIPSGLL